MRHNRSARAELGSAWSKGRNRRRQGTRLRRNFHRAAKCRPARVLRLLLRVFLLLVLVGLAAGALRLANPDGLQGRDTNRLSQAAGGRQLGLHFHAVLREKFLEQFVVVHRSPTCANGPAFKQCRMCFWPTPDRPWKCLRIRSLNEKRCTLLDSCVSQAITNTSVCILDQRTQSADPHALLASPSTPRRQTGQIDPKGPSPHTTPSVGRCATKRPRTTTDGGSSCEGLGSARENRPPVPPPRSA